VPTIVREGAPTLFVESSADPVLDAEIPDTCGANEGITKRGQDVSGCFSLVEKVTVILKLDQHPVNDILDRGSHAW
jgi:hypothetical protein